MANNKKDKIIFSHPALSKVLTIDVNPESVVWSYGLKTQNYPTFGGEVVQILSMFIEDMTITGMVSSYAKMETIYSWFVAYMQRATQGKTQAYDTTPVTFEYPARGWKFLIQPKAAPGFKYGRDVVAPTWSITAAVVESPESFESTLRSSVEAQAASTDGFKPFGTATAEIGFSEFNPWTTPNTGKAYKEGATKKYYAELSGANGPFNSFMKSFLTDDAKTAEALGANYSKPSATAFANAGVNTQDAGNTQRPDGTTPPVSGG